MLSRNERRLLGGLEESLLKQEPRLADEFDQLTHRVGQHRRLQARVCTLAVVGVLVMCVGVAVTSFDAAMGLPLAALGCVLLVSAVVTARHLPTVVGPDGTRYGPEFM